MERLPEELVRHVGSVELGRVDVIDPGIDRSTDDRQGLGAILGWSEHPGPRELHGAETHTANRSTGEQNGFAGHGAILPYRTATFGRFAGPERPAGHRRPPTSHSPRW